MVDTSNRNQQILPLVDRYGRGVTSDFVEGEIDRGVWRPVVVQPEVSGIARPMEILLASRSSDLIKWAWPC